MIIKKDKNQDRRARHARVRKNISGTEQRPRLNVYRSTCNIYAQVIDDTKGATLCSASTLDAEVAKLLKGKSKTEASKLVGAEIAKRALKAGVKEVVFDRGGYIFTGRVAALAQGARDGGLKF